MLKNISKMGSVLNKLEQKSISGGTMAIEGDRSHCKELVGFCNDAHINQNDYMNCMAACGC